MSENDFFQQQLRYELVTTWAWWFPFKDIQARWIIWKTKRKVKRWNSFREMSVNDPELNLK